MMKTDKSIPEKDKELTDKELTSVSGGKSAYVTVPKGQPGTNSDGCQFDLEAPFTEVVGKEKTAHAANGVSGVIRTSVDEGDGDKQAKGAYSILPETNILPLL